jgi:hypothetical protein
MQKIDKFISKRIKGATKTALQSGGLYVYRCTDGLLFTIPQKGYVRFIHHNQ